MEMRGRVKWEGAGNLPDEMVEITNKVKVTYVQHETAETANKAAASRKYLRREDMAANKRGGQQASSFPSATARGALIHLLSGTETAVAPTCRSSSPN